MKLQYQHFTKLYNEFINDDNLIKMALKNMKQLDVHYIDITDIYYFIILFKGLYREYYSNITHTLDEFILNNNYLFHTISDKYIISDKVVDINLDDIYNHYPNVEIVDNLFKEYLKSKYLKEPKKQKKRKIYRHVQKLI